MRAKLGFALAAISILTCCSSTKSLAVGDEAFQEKCVKQIQKFRAEGKTIIFVSHVAEAVKTICDRACVLDHGSAVFVGEVGRAIETYHQLLVA
jgi:ABC-type polysaccharide/polyol phosphate transport system ATPase subunit